MPSETPTVATLDDLYRIKDKAELIAGRIVHDTATGFRPALIGGRIYQSLDDHVAVTSRGVALPENLSFIVPELSSGRQSFSPDVALYIGPLPDHETDFLEGPPTLAVEVRGKGDYGDAAEAAMAAKRADYFEAGTEVVWDVDPIGKIIRSYRADAPATPSVFRPGRLADAEPAVPGWRLVVDRLFV